MKIFKETIQERINKNFNLFIVMVLGIIIIFFLLGKFYHWDKWIIGYAPYAFTINGIFSNNWMFISSALYSIIGIGIIVYLFVDKIIRGNKKRTNKWYYQIIIMVSLGVHILFYITNPWYTLQTHPRFFMYQDGKNITNKEIYFYLTERYGFREDLYKPFKTLDDSIEGLEFAKKYEIKLLYKHIYYDLEIFGYKKVFEKYDDITFQSYFLRTILGTNYLDEEKLKFFKRNVFFLKNLSEITSNDLVKNISMKALNEYEIFDKKNNNINELIKKFREGLLKESWEIKLVNEGVFEY